MKTLKERKENNMWGPFVTVIVQMGMFAVLTCRVTAGKNQQHLFNITVARGSDTSQR